MTQLRLAIEPGELEAICDVVEGSQFPQGQEQALQEALDSFSHAANLGMFCGSRHEPERSSVVPIKPPVCALGERGRWRYHAQCIDVGAFKVLFNMLEKIDAGPTDDLSIQVMGVSRRSARVLESTDLSQLPYPETTAEAAFTVEDNLAEPTAREVFVRVDFHNEVTKASAAIVFDVLDSWQEVVQRGGFPGPPGSERHGVLTLAEHYLVSPYLIEFAIYGYIGPTESYTALLNALHRIHRTQNPIVGVELE